MSERLARAVSFGLLGGIAAIVFALLGIQVWVGFIAWAWYVQAGANGEAFMKTVASMIWGAILGGIALMLAIWLRDTMGLFWMIRALLTVWLTIIVLIMSSSVSLLSLVPAGICGYAAVLGIVLQSDDMRTVERLIHPGRTNGLVTVILSVILGAIFGVAAEKVAAAFKKS
jgi:Protein of unknown function (DUF1097)